MPNETCTVRHINHTAIVVKDINDSISFYEDLFGVSSGPVEDIEDQGVKACLIKIGGTQLEIIQPVQADTGVAKFLENRGEGLHHIGLEVENIENALEILKSREVQLIDQKPRHGLSGTIAFLHPRATKGVLIELVQP
ncbi:MAG: methylmalonyl-CoA epimerase [Chloroflexi bacterium]|nr:methylmalonyl-CoA epimerase [Chloroflexota bacterium]|tara:strand:+ start:16090 stop:16503 length:414 start_codon:yes stop_codon:yes gene_type:complete